MKKEIKDIIEEIKNYHEESLEWYPTTHEMLNVIYEDLRGSRGSVLDIGCGDCRFYDYLLKRKEDEREERESIEKYNKDIEEKTNKIDSLKCSISYKQKDILEITPGTIEYEKKYGDRYLDNEKGREYYINDLKNKIIKEEDELQEL